MKHFKNAATYLLLIYTTVLGLTTLLNLKYPLKTASFIEFFLPLNIDISQQPFIRYRMVLWLVATIVFLILVPIIGYFGIVEMNVKKFQRIHWGNFVVAIIAIPICWVFYPLIALCTTCWTGNDIFYFILTIGLFIALQTFAQAILLKAQLFFGKK